MRYFLQEMNSTLHDDFKARLQNSTEFASNSLAIVTKILSLLANLNIPIHRKLLGSGESSDFPSWLRPADRRLLQDNSIVPNVTVAADGTGDVLTIKEAMDKVPKKATSRFIIHVKAGTYTENIVLDKDVWNVMIYGEGKDMTIISGSLNFVDGTTTFNTATFAVVGKGFIAKNIKFKNTAGAEKHQAVAFRSGSDMSVMYQCSFDAFQDTLYTHSNRQFYLECDITGTIDFIFGNSAAVFQRCQIMPRQPMPNQFNTITAQGKKDPNQNTGLSIQKCSFSALDGNLIAPTYLGRPWKDFSTTIIMQSNIGGFLNPKGWIQWVSGVDPPRTINYGEYQNTGPGASTTQRVTWSGYKPTLTASEAGKFTVESFIGSDWLTQANTTASTMDDTLRNSNTKVSAYYQTRAAHHGVVTSDWLAQAQAAVGQHPPESDARPYSFSATSPSSGKPFSVIDEFNNWRKQPDLAEAVAAIRALAAVIRYSEATTMMELEIELKKASDSLKSWDTTSISLTAGCDLFMRYVTRTSALEYEDFNSAKSRLIERAEKFGEISYKARKIIAMLGQDFIFDGCTILVHGFSRVVLELFKAAAQNNKLFRVFCTEGRPDRTGLLLSNELAKLDVPVKLLIDSAVAYSMDEVDMVLVGADGVVESGGIINMMGTYQIALVAHTMNKPVYVAAESYKFARLYPLDQKDMAPALRPIDFGVPIPAKVDVETSARDYTPPQYLTLLFTDLGVLTPSVVSDELIQLYL
ncbi:hypothetical protein SAY86_019145 [Trapa natans]|uniref:Translation initiation factor eIF2B subunit alpha n=1 Tax=Trapa natans TaxID=22666 RepID=A0AAN7LSA3_TRANT|nr:hypothetical protein SAY86_019145 [Trapa natans]